MYSKLIYLLCGVHMVHLNRNSLQRWISSTRSTPASFIIPSNWNFSISATKYYVYQSFIFFKDSHIMTAKFLFILPQSILLPYPKYIPHTPAHHSKDTNVSSFALESDDGTPASQVLNHQTD